MKIGFSELKTFDHLSTINRFSENHLTSYYVVVCKYLTTKPDIGIQFVANCLIIFLDIIRSIVII